MVDIPKQESIEMVRGEVGKMVIALQLSDGSIASHFLSYAATSPDDQPYLTLDGQYSDKVDITISMIENGIRMSGNAPLPGDVLALLQSNDMVPLRFYVRVRGTIFEALFPIDNDEDGHELYKLILLGNHFEVGQNEEEAFLHNDTCNHTASYIKRKDDRLSNPMKFFSSNINERHEKLCITIPIKISKLADAIKNGTCSITMVFRYQKSESKIIVSSAKDDEKTLFDEFNKIFESQNDDIYTICANNSTNGMIIGNPTLMYALKGCFPVPAEELRRIQSGGSFSVSYKLAEVDGSFHITDIAVESHEANWISNHDFNHSQYSGGDPYRANVSFKRILASQVREPPIKSDRSKSIARYCNEVATSQIEKVLILDEAYGHFTYDFADNPKSLMERKMEEKRLGRPSTDTSHLYLQPMNEDAIRFPMAMLVIKEENDADHEDGSVLANNNIAKQSDSLDTDGSEDQNVDIVLDCINCVNDDCGDNEEVIAVPDCNSNTKD